MQIQQDFFRRNDLTIILFLYFLLMPIGKTLWYPLIVAAALGGFALYKEIMANGDLNLGTKWLITGGSFIFIPAALSLVDTVDLQRSLVFVISYPLFFLAGYFVYKRISSGVSLLPLTWLLLALVGLWGSLAVWQYLDPNNPFGETELQYQGIFTRDNPYVDGGLMFGVILGSLFSFFIFTLWAIGYRVFAVITGVILIGLIFLSGTRSAWLSVIVTLFAIPIVAYLRGIQLTRKAVGLGVVTLILTTSGGWMAYQQPALQKRVDQTLSAFENPTREGINRALSGRLDIWEDAIQIGIDNPLVGAGVNNFRFAQPMLENPVATQWISPWDGEKHNYVGPTHTHQIFLEAWSGAGLLGVIGLGIYFVWLTRISIKVATSGTLIAVGALIALWSGFFPLNTHNNFYGGWLSAWFWVWMGISAGLIFKDRQIPPVESN